MLIVHRKRFAYNCSDQCRCLYSLFVGLCLCLVHLDCTLCSNSGILSSIFQAEKLFKEADINGDGCLTVEEFRAVMEKAQRLYPHVNVFFAKAKDTITAGGWVLILLVLAAPGLFASYRYVFSSLFSQVCLSSLKQLCSVVLVALECDECVVLARWNFTLFHPGYFGFLVLGGGFGGTLCPTLSKRSTQTALEVKIAQQDKDNMYVYCNRQIKSALAINRILRWQKQLLSEIDTYASKM